MIIETEILDSMDDRNFPSRKEVADLQSTIIDGADVIMLNRETSYGKFPIEAVQEVAQVLAESERAFDSKKKFEHVKAKSNMSDKNEILAVIISSLVLQERSGPIDMILCLSQEGKMSKILSKYKLPIPLISACPDAWVIKQMSMLNGINAIKVPQFNSKILGADHLIRILLKAIEGAVVSLTPGH